MKLIALFLALPLGLMGQTVTRCDTTYASLPGTGQRVKVTNCYPATVTPHRTSTAYHWSVAAVIAGNAADAASSWGLREGNPLLGTKFNAGSVSIKGGIVVGSLLIQRHTIRKNSKLEKVFTWINFSWGGGLAGVAVRNERIR